MTANLIWSFVLATIGITGIYLAGSKNIWGWVLSFAVQMLWIIFAVTTRQYGFILSAVVYGAVYARNFMKWKRDTSSQQSTQSYSD